jgi:hypothetical protein
MGFFDSTQFLLLPYIVAAIFIGFLGKHKKIGNIKASFLLVIISLTLTPVVGLIFLYFARVPNPFEEEKKFLPKSYKCDNCGWKFHQKFEFCPNCNAKSNDDE